jgi:hypothetical protein
MTYQTVDDYLIRALDEMKAITLLDGTPLSSAKEQNQEYLKYLFLLLLHRDLHKKYSGLSTCANKNFDESSHGLRVLFCRKLENGDGDTYEYNNEIEWLEKAIAGDLIESLLTTSQPNQIIEGLRKYQEKAVHARSPAE